MPANEERLRELLKRWKKGYAEGREPSTKDLCSDSPELQQETQRRIFAVEAPEQKALDQEADQSDGERREHERAGKADMFGQHDREVRTQRVERTVGEIDQAAQ